MDLICWTGQARLANIMILKAISKQVKTEFSDMNYDRSSQDFVKASVLISIGAESLPRLVKKAFAIFCLHIHILIAE